LHGAFGAPIIIHGRVEGVVEFFSHEVLPPDEELLRLFDALGSQIGQFIERKRAEEALRDSEALYHSLVDTLPLNILRKDRNGYFTFANRLFSETLGRPLSEILGKTDFDFFPAHLAEKYRSDDEKVMNTGKAFEDIEEHQTPTGEKLYVQVIKAPVLDAAGETIGVEVIFWDVTDRKRAEEQLKQTMKELARSNRELEQFAYVASHDLQEPLRMVGSYCQLLKRRYQGKLDSDADEFIHYAVDGAMRMQTLINDLLAYSRVGTRGKPFQPTDCQAVFAKARDNLRMALEESQGIVTHDALPTVLADATQLVQLFQNLLGNAIKFRGSRRPQIHVGVERRVHEWRFSVQDNGIGINPPDHDRIFTIFQRLHTRDEYPGTGLGLAICKKIVERHGGRIGVESAAGQGSTFWFTLPVMEGDSHGHV
jgi:PAS domain S-box-containing protein